MISYDKQTINTPNPIARYAHRNRLSKAISIVKSQVGINKVLDYGCGLGIFINAIQGINGIEAMGYEPFMNEKVDSHCLIFKDFPSVEAEGPFDIITIFETIEHLDERELYDFLSRADKILTKKGKILVSVPIEIGPALLMKEINRCILYRRSPENSLHELFLASLFGIAAKRTDDLKSSHKGFDFRKIIRFLEAQFGVVTIVSYGPLPIDTWYGNSQVYFWLTRHAT